MPSPYMITEPAAIPHQLRALDQWANWHDDKVIQNPHTGGNGSSTNPNTWSSFTHAVKKAPNRLAFIFTRKCGLVGIDLDHCRDPETGQIEPWAMAIIERFPNVYWEISLSGTGLHGIGRGILPDDASGRHPKGIGIFDDKRYFVMTGHVLPGHETLGDFGDGLADLYREIAPTEPKHPPSPPPTLTLDDHDIVDRLINEQNGKARHLLAGDTTGYPDNSSARFGLGNKLAFYTDDIDQAARIIRTSGLFKDGDSERDRDRKAKLDARNALSGYTGPRYDPTRKNPRLTVIPPSPTPSNTTTDALGCADVRAELATAHARIAELEVVNASQAEQISTLQERVRLADEREAIQRNTKLGAPRQTGAALATLFKEERPKEPGTTTPYRMPLAKLADRTGLSADACSRQLKKLAQYETPDGTPVLHVDMREIPRGVNQETGEIIEPHREIWVGPGVDRSAFGYVLAQLTPDQAPKHGGKPDRNVCPEHPNAGVLRRTRNMRRITHECAHCQKVLDTQTVPVGRESTEHLRSMATPPEAIQHDAFADEPAATDPMPQHAASIDNHVSDDLSGKMRYSPTPGLQSPLRQSTGPPPGWEDNNRRVYGQLSRGDAAS